ncbi:hypothetical protein EXS54_00025 [Patescibacteria group bacterium]|nr:hypothetical protein [Patescibacteria group bacterium]
MELSYYGHFFKRHALLILGVAVLVAAIAGGVSAVQKTQTQATGSVLVKVQDNRQLADYDYDQYYVTQAVDLYTTNIVSWLNSGQNKDDIRQTAKVSDARIVGKKNGGTVELTVTADQPDQATAVLKATTALIASRTSQIAPGPSRSSFQTVASPASTHEQKSQPLRDAVIGFIAGLVLGLVLALLVEAMRPRSSRSRG